MYEYKMKLGFSNREFDIKTIENLLIECRDIYNLRSSVATNKKKISSFKILDNDNVICLTLSSKTKLRAPLKGLHLFSKLLLERLSQEQKNDIIRNKSLFKVLDCEDNNNFYWDRNENVNENVSDLNLKSDEIPSIEELFERVKRIEEILNIN